VDWQSDAVGISRTARETLKRCARRVFAGEAFVVFQLTPWRQAE
jgi:hypothetical protein